MSNNTVLVNTFYPVTYFQDNSIIFNATQNPKDFWASDEELAPSSESLTFNFGRSRPINFIDFEISAKPIDIVIEYQDNSGKWIEVTYDPQYINQTSVHYLPSTDNPWVYREHHFNTVQSQYIRITFERRADPFPSNSSNLFPWSIEVRNARFINTMQAAEDYIPDMGTDILGNSFRTDLKVYEPENITDNDSSTYWMSQPNPSPFAVEAIYFDLRNTAIPGTMGYLDALNNDLLDERLMLDVESYLSDGVVIDELYIDPITYGPYMHFYYSLDDSVEWDDKLWIPINRTFILKRGYHALPAPIFTKYLKIEFTNLSAIPYNTREYPTLPPTTYRKYPTWVQDYFASIKKIDSVGFINPIDRVTVDPLALGFRNETDLLDTGLDTKTEPAIASPQQEIEQYLTGASVKDQGATEDKINFNSPFMYQRDLITQLDTSRALSRVAIQNESAWNAESTPITEPVPLVQSVSDLSQAREEKTTPAMYFPFKCRHSYQIVQSSRPNKIAYHVGVKDVKFLRRDFTAEFDEQFYLEGFDDLSHIETLSDLLQDDWRYEVSTITSYTDPLANKALSLDARITGS